MRKINLEALESKNMTVAAEDTLSEINGGCTYVVRLSTRCGRNSYWMDWVGCTMGCTATCPSGAASFWAEHNDQLTAGKKVTLWKSMFDSEYSWHAKIGDNGPAGTVSKRYGRGWWVV